VEQSRRRGARRAGHVLAVVEHDQEAAGAQVAGDGLGQGSAAFRLLNAEHGRDLGQDEFTAVDRGLPTAACWHDQHAERST